MTAIVVVIYGAPGTGKTTLLNWIADNAESEDCPYMFATIGEPTHSAAIVSMLKQMYEETPEQVAAGLSVASKTQRCIFNARVKSYDHFVRVSYDALIASAKEAKRQAVVVLDGHVLTDDMIYVLSKYASGQISRKQAYAHKRRVVKFMMQQHLAQLEPDVYCQLYIGDDPLGIEHHRRVCGERQTEAERNVPPSVFANLAKYANDAVAEIRAERPTLTYARIDTKSLCDDQLFDHLIAVLDLHRAATS